MTHGIEITGNELPIEERASMSSGLIPRSAVLVYGLLAYIVGVAGLLWLILASGGLAPVGLSEFKVTTGIGALVVNLGLIVLFGVQHSVMPRQGFQKWYRRYWPEATRRASYMLASGIVTMMAIYFWQPMGGTMWQVENGSAAVALWIVFALGWAYLFISTFVTNHFELMGLRQVYLYFRNKPYTSLPFTKKFMYRYSRHPMMLGFLVGMWAIPVMTVSHFVMSSLLTLYIFIGVFFEERDLVRNFGETYRKYKKDIATFIPKVF